MRFQRKHLLFIAAIIIVSAIIITITIAATSKTSAKTSSATSGNDDNKAPDNVKKVENRRMVGYYLEAATGNNCPGIPAMSPDKIPAQYYTHLVYGFSPLISTVKWQLEDPTVNEVQRYSAFNGLKNDRPRLKTMLSLGGDLPNIAPMSQMVADPSKRSHFINTTIAYVRKYGFDGIDIDWEFPTDGSRGGSPSDAAGFAAFVSDLRIAIDNEARGRSTKLLLSSIVPGGPFWGQYYLINQTIADLDWVNILAYNVLGTWGSQTDCSAPLENPHNIQSDSVANALKYYLQLASQRGVRGDKFNLGLSFWGIAYKLKKAIGASSSSPGVGTPSYTNGESPATPGFCTRQPGYLAYFEIDRIRSNSSIISTPVVEDGVSKCQYFTYNSDQWVAYDDQKTLSEKIDLGLALGLTGVSVWGMDADKPGSWDLTESVYSKIIN